MEIDFIRTFLAVVDEGSIAGAARKLGLTASAVALRLKVLETELDAQLISRFGRTIQPTSIGVRLTKPCRDFVADAGRLRRLAQSNGQIDGELRLGVISTASAGILPPLLRSLARSHPGIDIFIEPGVSLDLCERVLDGALDAAIIVQPPRPLLKGEEFTTWLSEPLIMIVPPEHADQDPLELLERTTFIRYDRSNWGGRIVDDYLKLNGWAPREHYELDSLEAIVAMVSAGLGIAIIPDWQGPRPEGTEVVTLELPTPVPTRNVGLYRRRGSRQEELIAVVEGAFVLQAPKPMKSDF